jgi:hypothetical protein
MFDSAASRAAAGDRVKPYSASSLIDGFLWKDQERFLALAGSLFKRLNVGTSPKTAASGQSHSQSAFAIIAIGRFLCIILCFFEQ